MKLNEFLDWLESVRPSAYTAEQKTVWVNDLEASLWTEVFLQPMSLWKARSAGQGEAPLLLDESWRSLYAWYVWAMMDFASGEHAQYANAMAMYNQKLSQLQCWYAEEHEPSLRNARWTDWSAAAYTGAAESIPVYSLQPGWAVLGAECRVTTPFEDGETCITIGTEEAPDGLMAACQLTPAKAGLYRSLRFLAGDDGVRVIFVSGGDAGEVRVRLLLQPPVGCYVPPRTASASGITVIQSGGSGGMGADGKDGADGVSCTHEWSGTVLTVTSASGTSSADLKGEKGDKGDAGETGATGPQGPQGEQGDYFAPGVDADGNLSWTQMSAETGFIPLTTNIKGPKGDTGATGATGLQGEKGDTGAQGPQGVGISSLKQTTTSSADGGANVWTATLTNGTTSTFTVKNGSKGSTGATGASGAGAWSLVGSWTNGGSLSATFTNYNELLFVCDYKGSGFYNYGSTIHIPVPVIKGKTNTMYFATTGYEVSGSTPQERFCVEMTTTSATDYNVYAGGSPSTSYKIYCYGR